MPSTSTMSSAHHKSHDKPLYMSSFTSTESSKSEQIDARKGGQSEKSGQSGSKVPANTGSRNAAAAASSGAVATGMCSGVGDGGGGGVG